MSSKEQANFYRLIIIDFFGVLNRYEKERTTKMVKFVFSEKTKVAVKEGENICILCKDGAEFSGKVIRVRRKTVTVKSKGVEHIIEYQEIKNIK